MTTSELMVILAQPVEDHITDDITPAALRAPETYIRFPWNEKVDIWTFGCLVSIISFAEVGLLVDGPPCKVFEFVTGQALFKIVPQPARSLDEIESILYQMMCYTMDGFKPHILQYARRGGDYFAPTCAQVVRCCPIGPDPHLCS